jgi:hypothetical protein
MVALGPITEVAVKGTPVGARIPSLVNSTRFPNKFFVVVSSDQRVSRQFRRPTIHS